MKPQDFKVGQKVMLNGWTITPRWAEVTEVGKTFIEVEELFRYKETTRIRHDEFHKKLCRLDLYKVKE
jgi:hypothetical protein